MDGPSNRDITTLGASSDDEQRRAARHHDEARSRAFAIEAARSLHDRHVENIVIFDVRGLSDLMDYILIGSGTSDRQIKAVGTELKTVARDMGFNSFGRDVDEATTWLVVDFVDVVVHLFDPPTREHYDLEMMWGDAQRVKWKRDGEDKSSA